MSALDQIAGGQQAALVKVKPHIEPWIFLIGLVKQHTGNLQPAKLVHQRLVHVHAGQQNSGYLFLPQHFNVLRLQPAAVLRKTQNRHIRTLNAFFLHRRHQAPVKGVDNGWQNHADLFFAHARLKHFSNQIRFIIEILRHLHHFFPQLRTDGVIATA